MLRKDHVGKFTYGPRSEESATKLKELKQERKAIQTNSAISTEERSVLLEDNSRKLSDLYRSGA